MIQGSARRYRRRLPAAVAGLMLLSTLLVCARGATSASTALVDLDASALSKGSLKSWKNAGASGGEFAAGNGAAPEVSETSGRKAVGFDEGHYLASSFATPEALVGDKPFTLAVMAYVPKAVKRDVMVSWASRPISTAEFGYGAGNDGAFFGWDKSVRFANVPAAGQWHQIAYAYSAGGMKVYVDGVVDAKRAFTLSPKAGGHIYLGAGWNAVDRKPTFPFHGSLARVQIWDRALSQREIRNVAGSEEIFDVSPADGSVIAAEGATVRFEAGSENASAFALRFAADASLFDTGAVTPIRLDKPEATLPALKPGNTYFWRVDQLDAAGQVINKGEVRHFLTDSGPATEPFPRDHIAGISPDFPGLSWKPGRYAVSQRLYFGTDSKAVGDGSKVTMALTANETKFPNIAGTLKPGTTYYWRVEEVNGAVPSDKGHLWAFRTADDLRADDVTFFVGSDCHYGLGNNDELNRKVIDEMNWLPGKSYPKQAGGGIVATPRGVILDGDLLDKGFEPKTAPAAWAEFVADYGLTGADGRLAFPVYEGFGNHDGMTGKSVSRAGIKERNKIRAGLTAVSANGYHYSWDWGRVHLVQLNLFPGKDSTDCIVGPPDHNPEDSLGFLKEDLAKKVGASGKLVVIFCHYCYSGGMADWWTDAAKERFHDAVKGYHVALIHGHSHGAYFYTWKGLQAISDGSTAKPDSQSGDFMVVRVTGDHLIAVERKLDNWGICLNVSLPAEAR